MFSKCIQIVRWALLVALVIGLTGCGAGYRLHRANGAETLYRFDKNGHADIVYVVNEDGSMTVHDENDPVAKRYMANQHSQKQVKAHLDMLQTQKTVGPKRSPAASQLRIRQVKKARKRDDFDPIFVAVHEPALGPKMAQNGNDAKMTRQRILKFIKKEMTADRTIRVTSHMPDVDLFSESYFKEAAAFNTQTRKMVKMAAFHFKVDIQSKYLPEDNYTIEESGHWFENEMVIQRAMARVSKIIRKRIGPTIPAERYKFL